jgi:cell division protein FtsN
MRLNPYIVKKTISDTKIYRVRVYSTDESDNLQNAIKKLEKKGYKFSIIKK